VSSVQRAPRDRRRKRCLTSPAPGLVPAHTSLIQAAFPCPKVAGDNNRQRQGELARCTSILLLCTSGKGDSMTLLAGPLPCMHSRCTTQGLPFVHLILTEMRALTHGQQSCLAPLEEILYLLASC
jgi:hypothetical protein